MVGSEQRAGSAPVCFYPSNARVQEQGGLAEKKEERTGRPGLCM